MPPTTCGLQVCPLRATTASGTVRVATPSTSLADGGASSPQVSTGSAQSPWSKAAPLPPSVVRSTSSRRPATDTLTLRVADVPVIVSLRNSVTPSAITRKARDPLSPTSSSTPTIAVKVAQSPAN